MRLAVIGSRGFSDYEKFCEIVGNEEFTSIVSGGAKGADILAEKFAKENNIEILVLKPDWNKHGKSAGFVRNTEIWDSSDFGIAFWDGKSKGTAHSFEIAKRQGKRLLIWNDQTKELYEN